MGDHYIFAEITSTDRAGVVYVAAILSLLYSASTLVARFLIKFHSLGWDDWAILAATIVALGQYIAVFVPLGDGLGISSSILAQDAAENMGGGVMAGQILFIIAVALTKLSVVLFIKRLLTQNLRGAWWAANITMGLTVAWGVASALIISVGCSPTTAVLEPQSCTGKMTRWGIVIGTDAVLELMYVALGVSLVMPLQMSTYIKFTVIAAFAFRLPCVVLSALHGGAINHFLESPDHGLAIANRLLWQQVVLGYALVSATIPTIKSFIRGYNKAIGRDASYKSRRLGGGYGLDSYGRAGDESGLELRSVTKASANRSQGGEVGDRIKLRPKEGQQYRADAFVNTERVDRSARRTSSGSNGSEDPIIRRDISIAVEYEDALKK